MTALRAEDFDQIKIKQAAPNINFEENGAHILSKYCIRASHDYQMKKEAKIGKSKGPILYPVLLHE